MSDSTVKQRKPAADGAAEAAAEKLDPKAAVSKPADSIASIPAPPLASYDYVLKVQADNDPETKEPTPEAAVNIKRLVKTLDFNGFEVEVRPDTNSNFLLFFVKYTDFSSLLAKAQQVDALYFVTQLDDESKLTVADRLRLVYVKLTSTTAAGGAGIIPGEENWTFVKALIPVANWAATRTEYSNFRQSMFKLLDGKVHNSQTQFLLKNYGTRHTFYFKTLNLYTIVLIVLAAAGIICNHLFGRLSTVFTAINLTTLAAFYLTWYAYEKKWAKDWNVVNVSDVDIARTDKKDPPYKVMLRKAAFTPIALASGANLVSCQFICFLIEIFLTEIYDGPGKQYLSLVPTILVCSIVPVLTAIYSIIVNKFLAFENNPTRSTNAKSYLVKMFVYNFLASYVPLFITSFLYLPVGYKTNEYLEVIDTYADNLSNRTTYVEKIPVKRTDYYVNSDRLNTQYKYFILTNQVVGTAMEFLLPIVLHKVFAIPALAKLMGTPESLPIELKDAPEEKEFLEDIRAKLALDPYDINDDYRQLVLQSGFMILFGPVWSVGALVSLFIELIQSKADYFKILRLVQPPNPDRSESSYPWPLFFKTLLIIGSFTSVCLTEMYTGGNISASVDASSVQTSWVRILPVALLSALAMEAVIIVGEAIIDEYFIDDGAKIEQREVQLRKIVGEGDDEKSTNNVDGLIEEATSLPKTLYTAPASAATSSEPKVKKQE